MAQKQTGLHSLGTNNEYRDQREVSVISNESPNTRYVEVAGTPKKRNDSTTTQDRRSKDGRVKSEVKTQVNSLHEQRIFVSLLTWT